MPLFSSLDDDELGRLLDVGRLEHWQRGAIVLEQGAFGPRMMVIVDGSVEILRRDHHGVSHAIAALGPGDVLGEMSLLLDTPRSATVRATSQLTLFAIDRTGFEAMIASDDRAALRFALAVARVLASRLVRLNEVVVSLLAESDPLRKKFADARQEAFPLWDDDDAP